MSVFVSGLRSMSHGLAGGFVGGLVATKVGVSSNNHNVKTAKSQTAQQTTAQKVSTAVAPTCYYRRRVEPQPFHRPATVSSNYGSYSEQRRRHDDGGLP